MSKPDISIVLPVYNQAEHITRVCREYEAQLQRLLYEYEILLVVTGGIDNSPEVCRNLAVECPAIRCIDSVECGWGRAVRLGIAKARGEHICYTNSRPYVGTGLVALCGLCAR